MNQRMDQWKGENTSFEMRRALILLIEDHQVKDTHQEDRIYIYIIPRLCLFCFELNKIRFCCTHSNDVCFLSFLKFAML